MKKRTGMIAFIFIILFCTIWVAVLTEYVREHAFLLKVTADYCEGSMFRAHTVEKDCLLELKNQAEAADIDFYEYLAAAFLIEKGSLSDQKAVLGHQALYRELLPDLKKNDGFTAVTDSMRAVWNDLTYFPIPASVKNEDAEISFENSWLFERSFGGTRGHEGCDIMASLNRRGYYPVISMTDGTVEKIGWLPQGGYRIGIRAKSGAYFYYAHLYEYATHFKEGTQITAGQLLGYMGDSGYGEEGTIGKFDVHLHIGIYIKTEKNDEVSINPYYVLQYLEKKKLNYSY
ncbi:MAG: M23 family metallopeptidase [Lachnospiraceae bacterium]